MDSRLGNQVALFLLLRVIVHLTRALLRGAVLKWQGKEFRVFFKYERLPIFSFDCGRIEHHVKDCDVHNSS